MNAPRTIGMSRHFDPIKRLRSLEEMEAVASKQGHQLHDQQIAALNAVNEHRDAHNILKKEIVALRNDIKVFGFRYADKLKAYDDGKAASAEASMPSITHDPQT